MRIAVRRVLSVVLLALASVLAQGPAYAEPELDPLALFADVAPGTRLMSAEEILRRALDNLFGFDTALVLDIARRTSEGSLERTQFMIQRSHRAGARRMLAVSTRPAEGNRVLQVEYDDGREEIFAFVPGLTDSPMRTDYRLAEPFLATWYEIGANEPPPEMRMLAEYEVLAFAPTQTGGEDAYKLTLHSVVPRGYDRTEVLIARSDYALLEQRHYYEGSPTPALIAVSARADMVRYGDHTLPQRITYQDRTENSTIEVKIRHTPLVEDSDDLFFPNTFHRAPLSTDALPAEPEDARP